MGGSLLMAIQRHSQGVTARGIPVPTLIKGRTHEEFPSFSTQKWANPPLGPVTTSGLLKTAGASRPCGASHQGGLASRSHEFLCSCGHILYSSDLSHSLVLPEGAQKLEEEKGSFPEEHSTILSQLFISKKLFALGWLGEEAERSRASPGAWMGHNHRPELTTSPGCGALA